MTRTIRCWCWGVGYRPSDDMREFDAQWTEDDLKQYAEENISVPEGPICPYCGETIEYQYIQGQFHDAICDCV